MIAILSLLLVVLLLVTAARVATVALVSTGMSDEIAAFQARSALMGVGYTTRESEQIVNHPVRRRIVLWLMTLGNAGIITGVASLMLGFTGSDSAQTLTRTALLVGGLVALVLMISSPRLHRVQTRAIRWALTKFTSVENRDLAPLLRFSHDFTVSELYARDGDWIVGRPFSELHLSREGIAVLAIHRADGTFHGAPHGGTIAHPGDTLIAYGKLENLASLDDRRAGRIGEFEHTAAVEEFVEIVAEEDNPEQTQ